MKRIMLIAAALFAAAECAAAVTMPRVFGDNMVLQQGQRVPVWGKAALASGELSDERWTAYRRLKAEMAGEGTVRAESSHRYRK